MFVNKNAYNYPQNVVHMFAKNCPTVLHNTTILDTLSGELHRINAVDNIPVDCKYSLQSTVLVQNRKQTDTGGPANYLEKNRC